MCSTLVYSVAGGWGTYTTNGACSVTCSTGYQPTIAICNNPVPIGHGSCSGAAPTSTQPCDAGPCPSMYKSNDVSIKFYILNR